MQSSAYCTIHSFWTQGHNTVFCQRTAKNLTLVQDSLQTFNNLCPLPSDIWMSIQCSSLPPKIHNFIFLALHVGQWIETFWNHIPGYEERATCSACNKLEDLNHILLKCRRSGQQEVWNLMRQLWTKKHTQWPTLTLGLLLGCCAVIFCDAKGVHDCALVIQESIHLIWRFHCKTVLSQDNEPLPYQSIHNCWLQMINKCLALDRLWVNVHKLGVRALLYSLVTQT